MIFSVPSMLLLANWHHRSIKFNIGREGAQLFVGISVLHGVSQLNVTSIAGFQPRLERRHIYKDGSHF